MQDSLIIVSRGLLLVFRGLVYAYRSDSTKVQVSCRFRQLALSRYLGYPKHLCRKVSNSPWTD